MSANPKMYIDNLTHGHGSFVRQRRKFIANKERNWLTALTLNTFAKLSSNHHLNDLDKAVVEAFTNQGFSQDMVKGLGKAYLGMSTGDRQLLFPAPFASLTVESNYTFQQLTSDLPKLEQTALRMRNVSDIDVHKVHSGQASLRQFAVPRETLREFGSRVIRASVPNTTPPNPNYSIKAHSFRCLEQTSEWSANDEPYWVFSTIAKGIPPVVNVSQVFGGVDDDEDDLKNFASDDGVMWGPGGIPQDFPDGDIGCFISLFEHDSGEPAEAKAGAVAVVKLINAVLTASGAGTLITGIITALGGLVQFFLGFLDEDHIADHTFIFSRQAVVDHLGPKPNKQGITQSFDVTALFDDGDARYRLRIRVSRKT